MASFIIHGGRPLKGKVAPIANKNSILKLIPAALLSNETVELSNVPKTSDVRIMLKILKTLGAKVTYSREPGTVRINCGGVKSNELPWELISKIRASYLFIGPLLVKFGSVTVPEPGGCNFGNRRLAPFFEGLEQLGAKVLEKGDHYEIISNTLSNKSVWQTFPSVTATENLILTMVCSKGAGEIYNAGCEPHTQDLCNMLVKMGARIRGIGTNRLEIEGVDNLSGCSHEVIGDHLDVGAYIAAAVLTDGELEIEHAVVEHMRMILMMYERVGVKVEIDGDTLFVPQKQSLKVQKNIQGQLQYVEGLPWPNFPVDLMAVMTVLAAHADGRMFLYNKMDEFQMLFVRELMEMGVNAFIATTQQVIVTGPTKWRGAEVTSPYIIQSAVALFLAGLAAEGKTRIRNINALDRRYVDLDKKYNALGAKIEKVR